MPGPALPTRASQRTTSLSGLRSTEARLSAILFSCDGVLVDSERDGHRVALNEAMKAKGFKKECSVDDYGKLLNARGEDRLTQLWKNMGWDGMSMDLAKEIYAKKAEIFTGMLEKGKIPLRPGVLALIDEALAMDIPVAVCSSNTQHNVELIINSMGADRAAKISIFAGNRVQSRKPSPDIYNLACGTLGAKKEDVVVIEDDQVGVEAAKAAGVGCLVTRSTYSANDDIKNADRVIADLTEVDLSQVSTVALSAVGLNA